MLFFRWIMLFGLLGSIAAFALYIVTGDMRFRRTGLQVLKWVVLAGLGFFGVLILERVA